MNIDAKRVIDILLLHDNDLVKEATKAVYWQVVAETAMSQNGEGPKEEEAADEPVASNGDAEVVSS